MANLTATDILKSAVIRPILTDLLIATLILIAGFIIGRFLGRLITRLLSEIELNNFFRLATGISARIDHMIGSAISYLTYIVFIMVALDRMGLSSAILNMIAGGVFVVIIIAILLAIKDFVPNLFAGIFIHSKKMFEEGDKIETDHVKGKVIQIGLIETKLRSGLKDIIYIPNSSIIRSNKVKVKGRLIRFGQKRSEK